MIYICLGIIAFVLFFLYDWNSFTCKNRIVHAFFAIGCVLLLFSIGGAFFISILEKRPGWGMLLAGGMLWVIGMVLLIYTLFFALPFSDTYEKADNNGRKVYKKGVYALCRHPGVLWFMVMFTGLVMMTGNRLMLVMGILFSALNVLYVVFQDRVTFSHQFEDYEDYRKTTPFLIPNIESIKKCFNLIK